MKDYQTLIDDILDRPITKREVELHGELDMGALHEQFREAAGDSLQELVQAGMPGDDVLHLASEQYVDEEGAADRLKFSIEGKLQKLLLEKMQDQNTSLRSIDFQELADEIEREYPNVRQDIRDAAMDEFVSVMAHFPIRDTFGDEQVELDTENEDVITGELGEILIGRNIGNIAVEDSGKCHDRIMAMIQLARAMYGRPKRERED